MEIFFVHLFVNNRISRTVGGGGGRRGALAIKEVLRQRVVFLATTTNIPADPPHSSAESSRRLNGILNKNKFP